MTAMIFFGSLCVIGIIILVLVMLVRSNKNTNQNKTTVSNNQKRYIKDVKCGEDIQIEWYKIKGRIGYLKCINNDPQTKKILLEVTWANSKLKEQIILDYKSVELENFNLLNPPKTANNEPSPDDDFDMATLQKKMNEALEKEEYEIADELQKKINKILQKPK